MKIDHVTVAASELSQLERIFSELGLSADYGGAHSNGATHMSVLGFPDGSYIELISTMERGMTSPWWGAHIAGDGGACAWSVCVNDISEEVRRLRNKQVFVGDPTHFVRMKPDGTSIEWLLSTVGKEEMGRLHPFIIQDITPRNLRVLPSFCVENSEIIGVSRVIIGVERIADHAVQLKRAYDLYDPHRERSDELGAWLHIFGNSPLILAEPTDDTGWLAGRVKKWGISPCAYLIETADIHRSTLHRPVASSEQWCGAHIAWINLHSESWKLGFMNSR